MLKHEMQGSAQLRDELRPVRTNRPSTALPRNSWSAESALIGLRRPSEPRPSSDSPKRESTHIPLAPREQANARLHGELNVGAPAAETHDTATPQEAVEAPCEAPAPSARQAAQVQSCGTASMVSAVAPAARTPVVASAPATASLAISEFRPTHRHQAMSHVESHILQRYWRK